jgi:hypothetical protein
MWSVPWVMLNNRDENAGWLHDWDGAAREPANPEMRGQLFHRGQAAKSDCDPRAGIRNPV